MLKYLISFWIVACMSLAQAWHPPAVVKVIVGQSPGGGNEFAFRGISPILEKNYPDTKFIFEYVRGLDNVIAMNHFAEQRSDGSSILVVVQATGFVAAPVAYASKLKVDPMNYTSVTSLAKSPMAFVVSKNSKFNSVPQLIEYIKNKNKLNIGVSGSINLLVYGYLLDQLGASTSQVQAIRYNSPTDASLAAATDIIDVAIVPLSVPKPLIDSGRLRLLSHTGSSVIPGLDSVAMMKNYIPGLVLDANWSVFLPPNTADEIADWYQSAFLQAISVESARQYYNNNWATIDKSSQGKKNLDESIKLLRQQWIPTANKVIKEDNTQ